MINSLQLNGLIQDGDLCEKISMSLKYFDWLADSNSIALQTATNGASKTPGWGSLGDKSWMALSNKGQRGEPKWQLDLAQSELK